MFTYNEEVLCSAPCDIGVTGAVSAVPLIALLQKMPDKVVSISASKKTFILKGENKASKIKFDRQIHLPVEQVPLPKKWTPLPAGFTEALDLAQNCCSTSDLHKGLSKVHITPKHIEACDNVQACRVSIATGMIREAFMRSESSVHIAKSKVTKYAEDKNWLHFRSASHLVLSCRRYLEKYPDLTELFKFKGAPIKMPKGLAAATERAAIFTDQSKVSVNNQELVSVNLKSGKLTIKGSGDLGWYRETEKVKYKGPELDFAISPNVLKRIAKEHTKASVTGDRMCIDGETWRLIFCLFKKEKSK